VGGEGGHDGEEDPVSPFSDAFEAMKYLDVPGQTQQSLFRDATVDPEALQELIVAVANKFEALEQRIAEAESKH
jgi:hypothetical protein